MADHNLTADKLLELATVFTIAEDTGGGAFRITVERSVRPDGCVQWAIFDSMGDVFVPAEKRWVELPRYSGDLSPAEITATRFSELGDAVEVALAEADAWRKMGTEDGLYQADSAHTTCWA